MDDYTVEKLKEMVKELTYMAYHDELTGLPNRRMLTILLKETIEKAKQQDTKMALIFMDIDSFKKINDRFGHSNGDHFLIEVAKRLTNLSLAKTYFFRQSGDEFVILVEQVDALKETIAAITHIFDECFVVENDEFHASVSLGVSLFPDHGENVDELMKHADLAMYKAKKQTGSHIYYALTKDQVSSHNQLQFYYQPKINMYTEKMMGIKVFASWNDYEVNDLSFNSWCLLSEEVFLITVASQMKVWEELYDLSLRVIVNLSPLQLKQKTFVSKVRKIIEDTGVNPRNLEFKIPVTNRYDTEEFMDTLTQLKTLKITISSNDFDERAYNSKPLSMKEMEMKLKEFNAKKGETYERM